MSEEVAQATYDREEIARLREENETLTRSRALWQARAMEVERLAALAEQKLDAYRAQIEQLRSEYPAEPWAQRVIDRVLGVLLGEARSE